MEYKKGEFLIMSTEAVDRRVRRTRKQLRECLVTLLKQKKVQDITVRELTEPVSYTHLDVYKRQV